MDKMIHLRATESREPIAARAQQQLSPKGTICARPAQCSRESCDVHAAVSCAGVDDSARLALKTPTRNHAKTDARFEITCSSDQKPERWQEPFRRFASCRSRS